MSNKKPQSRFSLRTKKDVDPQNTYINLLTFWENDNGFLSGRFSDGWSPQGKDGWRITNVMLDGGQTIHPAGVWVNSIQENESSNRVWLKDKESGETTSLFSFTTQKTEKYGTQVQDYNFADDILAFEVERISPDKEVTKMTIMPVDCFLNGTITEPEPELVEGDCPF